MKKIALIILSFGVGFTSTFAKTAGVIFHGKVLDNNTHAIVKAEVDIYFDNDFVTERADNTLGEFSETLSKYGWYIITVNANGYLESTDTLWILNDERSDIVRDYYLTPVEAGLNVVLNNVYFDFGKTSLTDESNFELDKVVQLLQRNANVSCEIAGHTDADGSADFNMLLSKQRAAAVVDYLVRRGIERSRLFATGYGATKPIDITPTKIGRAKNRRVEFVVTKVN